MKLNTENPSDEYRKEITLQQILQMLYPNQQITTDTQLAMSAEQLQEAIYYAHQNGIWYNQTSRQIKLK